MTQGAKHMLPWCDALPYQPISYNFTVDHRFNLFLAGWGTLAKRVVLENCMHETREQYWKSQCLQTLVNFETLKNSYIIKPAFISWTFLSFGKQRDICLCWKTKNWTPTKDKIKVIFIFSSIFSPQDINIIRKHCRGKLQKPRKNLTRLFVPQNCPQQSTIIQKPTIRFKIWSYGEQEHMVLKLLHK